MRSFDTYPLVTSRQITRFISRSALRVVTVVVTPPDATRRPPPPPPGASAGGQDVHHEDEVGVLGDGGRRTGGAIALLAGDGDDHPASDGLPGQAVEKARDEPALG